MRTSESVNVPAPPVDVFPLVAELGAYPLWLPLVHTAERSEDADGLDAWVVELRARVGPFARSKQLRMVRTAIAADRSVTFERSEADGRDHARWSLRAELAIIPNGTLLTMHLSYDGRLWTGGVLGRVFDEEVRRGRAGLLAAVSP